MKTRSHWTVSVKQTHCILGCMSKVWRYKIKEADSRHCWSYWNSQDHRTFEVGRDNLGPSSPNLPLQAGSLGAHLSGITTRRVLNIFREGDSTTSVGSLFLCSVTLSARKVFLMLIWNFLHSSFCLLPLVLILWHAGLWNNLGCSSGNEQLGYFLKFCLSFTVFVVCCSLCDSGGCARLLNRHCVAAAGACKDNCVDL